MKSPQLIRYTYLYEKNPASRVFAPLANTYRSLGMLSEAFDILKKGVRQHPDYPLGYIVLARCHRDTGELARAYDVLKHIEVIDDDNFSYKKLRAELADELGEVEDALRCYQQLEKIDIYNNYQRKILELESKLQSTEETYTQEKDLSMTQSSTMVDDWQEIDFSQTKPTFESHTDKTASHELASFTLINLYCEQGHYHKALQVVNTLLDQEPDNEEAKQAKASIIEKGLYAKELNSFEEDDELSEDHLDEQKRFDWAMEEDDRQGNRLESLEKTLRNFQEQINLKSAQVSLRADL